jgi:RND family efflux transporter MFP subunit
VKDTLLRWLPIPVLVFGALAAWLVGHGRSAPEVREPEASLRLVHVLEVHPSDLRITVPSHGTVEPRTEIDLVAEAGGRVVSVAPGLAAGGAFEAGEVLVELDPHDAEVEVDRAEAVLARIEGEVSLSGRRLRRLRALAERDIASRAELEEAEDENRIARARLKEARATLRQAARDLERTRVQAPFPGRVRTKQVDVGQFVVAGTPLARVYAVDSFEVRLPIQSSDLAYLDLPESRGANAEGAAGPAVGLRAEFAGRPAHWTGRIVRTEAAISPQSRTLHLVARVEDPIGRRSENGGDPTLAPLTVGLFVEAQILGRTFDDVVVLPRSALRGRSEVLVVDEANRLRARTVEVLRIDGDQVVAGSGLVAGERVSVSAAQALDGMRVRPAVVQPETTP